MFRLRPSLLLLLLAAALFGPGCRKDSDLTEKNPFPVIFVQGTLYGEVTDGQGAPLAGVTVTLGNQQQETDENGYFQFPESTVDRSGALLRFSAPGYFDLTKTVVPAANARTFVGVTMSVRTLAATLSAGAGGTATFGGASVQLPANGFVDASGQPYNGSVQVYATFLDPQQADMQRRMPGNLTALRSDGSGATLATFGMLGVELEGAAGQKLQLAPGKRATLRIPLGGAYAQSAPATIPLWHFDAASGRWMEEGSAARDGNAYIGEVSHFSFWNVDVPFEAVFLKGRVMNEAGDPIPDVLVRATIKNGVGANFPVGAFTTTSTGSDGTFSGFVPKGAELKVEVYSDCDEVVSTEDVGPLAADLDMGDLPGVQATVTVLVSGQAVDCNNAPLTEPSYVQLKWGNFSKSVPVESDGTFSATILHCDATTLTAQPYDPSGLKKGAVTSFNIAGETELQTGALQACVSVDEYLILALGGTTIQLIDVNGGVDGPVTYVFASGPDSTLVNFQLGLQAPGTQNPSYFSATLFTSGGNFVSAFCQSCPNLQVTLTKFGGVGEPIEGNFSGEVPSNGAMVPTSGTFRVIRDN